LIPVKLRCFLQKIAVWTRPIAAGTRLQPARSHGHEGQGATETEMGRGLLLWIIGIPLPIILVVWLLGGLH
jgi:hypothetical protein